MSMGANARGGIRHLVDDSVPGESSIVHDDMDLSVSELSGPLYESLQVRSILYVSCNGNCSARRCIIDGFGNGLGLGYIVSLTNELILSFFQCLLRRPYKVFIDSSWILDMVLLTAVKVSDDNFGALVGEEPSSLCPYALSRPGYNGYLTSKHALGVVEVRGDLVQAVLRSHYCVRRVLLAAACRSN